jgi:hypothetical protein
MKSEKRRKKIKKRSFIMRRNSIQRVVVLLALSLSLLLISCDALGNSPVTWQEKAEEQNWAPGSGASLDQQLYWLGKYAKSNTEYVVEVKADEKISGHTYSDREMTNVTIRLKGDTATRTLSRKGEGPMFVVESGFTLILDRNITLAGRVIVRGGALQMNEGASISGGVYVGSGTFTMSGGAISGNSATSTSSSYGGGVYVGSGTFTMSGGTIAGNSSTSTSSYSNSSYGGGVYVSGTFSMSGGTISGNSSTSSYSNSSATSYGGGVAVSGGGSFTMSGGTISGNSITSTYSASSYGGGVYVGPSSTFTKTGNGTVYGYTAGNSNSNVVKDSSGVVQNNSGHAVYVYGYPSNLAKRRETTAGPGVNLDSGLNGAAGGWE